MPLLVFGVASGEKALPPVARMRAEENKGVPGPMRDAGATGVRCLGGEAMRDSIHCGDYGPLTGQRLFLGRQAVASR